MEQQEERNQIYAMQQKLGQMIDEYHRFPKAFQKEEIDRMELAAQELGVPFKRINPSFGEKLVKGTGAMLYNALDTMAFDVLPDEWAPETSGGFDDSMKSLGGLLGLLSGFVVPGAGPIGLAKMSPKLLSKFGKSAAVNKLRLKTIDKLKSKVGSTGLPSKISLDAPAIAPVAPASKVAPVVTSTVAPKVTLKNSMLIHRRKPAPAIAPAIAPAPAPAPASALADKSTTKLISFLERNPELLEKLARSRMLPYAAYLPAQGLATIGGGFGEGIGAAFDSDYPIQIEEGSMMQAMKAQQGY